MAGFRCPFCGEIMSIHSQTSTTWNMNFESSQYANVYKQPYLRITIYKCPNDACQKESIFADGYNGYIENSSVRIYPQSAFNVYPEYVPLAIRMDYQEACSIADLSPKAAATLARRCLQGMIHDFWGIHEKNLNAEITELNGKVPASQWKAIDAIRNIGNIGAHMEHDVDRIIDVEPDEANKLIRLIEHLIEKWYIDQHDSEELYRELANISQEKSAARKAHNTDHLPLIVPHL